ncbi:MAG: SMP-30/gluconolactonase/LRE family protein [Comamonadaceae bacterium]|nr:MAG: SMP-30/gluconolactonase/LRE family protein [Comamonadaceae bacterium]
MLADVYTIDLGFIEGPARMTGGRLCVASINRGCVYVIDQSGQVERKIETGGGPNGLAVCGETIYVAQNGGIFGASGKTKGGVQRIVGDKVELLFPEAFTAPNDLCFGPDGRLYVTDPLTDKALTEPVLGRVVACDVDTGKWEVVVEDRLFPNGLAFDSSGEVLYLAQTYQKLIERFRFDAGQLTSEGTFCNLTNGRPDGIAVDQEGKLWICTPGTGGIEVFTKDGRFDRRIELGEGTMTTNLCFGGADMHNLYVSASARSSVWTLRADAPGLALYPR